MKAPSIKQLQIDKSSQKMLIFASIGAFVFVFSIFSAKTLVEKMNYQNKVINAKTIALNNLTTDIKSSNSLNTAYNNFISPNTNLLGGSTSGTGPNSGNNAKLILDALPSEYDFPALATSLQKLLTSTGVTISGLSGSDSSTESSSTTSMPISGTTPIPFTFSINGSADNIFSTLQIFEKSIRPFQFQTITISGSNSNLSLNATAETFYLPSQNFSITNGSVQ